jgi:F0F1-type ATP synthase membrane subunit c/vacuolar-type H+-ATPase subunit K
VGSAFVAAGAAVGLGAIGTAVVAVALVAGVAVAVSESRRQEDGPTSTGG